ncbi:MAG: hypothetical protein IJI22_01755 [Bacilli bacterium]|nr:hypothetical protein [Bacilli bacterium]
MKKILKFNFIIIFLLACMFPLNIFATEPDPDPSDTPIVLPATFDSNGFQFTIEGVAIEYYDIPAAKIAELEDCFSEIAANHPEAKTRIERLKLLPEERQREFLDMINPMFEKKPTRIENLAAKDVAFYNSGVVNSQKALLIGTDFEFSEEVYNRINELIRTPYNAETEVLTMPNIVVKIKFNKVPNEYKYAYYKDYSSIFFSNALGRTVYVNEINLFETNNFPVAWSSEINNFTIKDEIQFSVELSKEKLSGPTDYVDKRILVSPYSVIDVNPENVDGFLDAPLDNVMLSEHGEDYGITELKYQYRNIEPSQPKDLEVAVENTSATYPLYIYVLSAIGILVGALVIVSTRLQSKQKQIEQ